MLNIDGKVYVYGGVASYSDALYNDVWLYNYGTWNVVMPCAVIQMCDP